MKFLGRYKSPLGTVIDVSDAGRIPKCYEIRLVKMDGTVNSTNTAYLVAPRHMSTWLDDRAFIKLQSVKA